MALLCAALALAWLAVVQLDEVFIVYRYARNLVSYILDLHPRFIVLVAAYGADERIAADPHLRADYSFDLARKAHRYLLMNAGRHNPTRAAAGDADCRCAREDRLRNARGGRCLVNIHPGLALGEGVEHGSRVTHTRHE